MSPLSWFILGLFVVGGGAALWLITPTWQCPVCHSYNVIEHKNEALECLGCGHTWRAV